MAVIELEIRMAEALERIASALEVIVERTEPKPVDLEARMREAFDALKATNPAFRYAFEAVQKQLEAQNPTRMIGESNAAARR